MQINRSCCGSTYTLSLPSPALPASAETGLCIPICLLPEDSHTQLQALFQCSSPHLCSQQQGLQEESQEDKFHLMMGLLTKVN